MAAHQAPPSMGFSRQEYWSGVPLPSPQIKEGIVLFWKNLITKQNPFTGDLYYEVSSKSELKCPGGKILHHLFHQSGKRRNLNFSSVTHGAYLYMDLCSFKLFLFCRLKKRLNIILTTHLQPKIPAFNILELKHFHYL